MAFSSLPTATLTVPFAAGLNTKGDKRAKSPPMLDVCLNVEFDDLGGLRTRYPFGAAQSDIFGGGAIANARKIVPNGDERLLFTKDSLYSWDAQQSKWQLRGEHLATAVDETAVFQTTEEQIDCDRAELNGKIIYTWTVSLSGGSKSYVAAKDAVTGAITLAPTALAGNAVRPRLVALDTKILLFFADGLGNLLAYALDPASPGTALAGASTTILAAAFNLNYSVAVQPGADAAFVAMRRNPTGNYEVTRVTAALAKTTVTKARSCTGAIAVAWHVTSARLLVVRNDGANILGDQLDVALADVSTGTAIGVAGFPVRNIAAAWQQTTTMAWVFWDDLGATFSSVFRNSITTAAAVGVTARTNYATIASGAFAHDGRVFLWMATDQTSSATDTTGATLFTAALQNCYLLYRDDGTPFGKSAFLRAGGRPGAGHITGVASPATNKYAWCGIEQRKIPTGATSLPTYAARSPLDIVVEFDTNRARRVARSGQTLYTSGEVLQYDGIGLTELGFYQYPFAFTVATAAGGSIPAGGYSYKAALRGQNAVGESERSTTQTLRGITLSGAQKTSITFDHFDHTKKRSPRASLGIEFYRTSLSPIPESPYYLVSGKDPSVTAGDNRYVENVPGTTGATFVDNVNNVNLLGNEAHPENGDILENLAPPPASIIAATETRVFLGAVAGDPDRLWYSKQRAAGSVAAWHESLTVQIPAAGGAITAIAFLNDTLVVFRERAIYLLPGDGFDNSLGGSNYGPARVVTTELGAVNHESVVLVPDGLMFKSHKGWCVLTRGWSVDDKIGIPVAAYDSETPLAAHVMQAQRQVRIVTANRMLVYDYLVNQWGEWSIAGALDAAIWGGTHYYLTATGPRGQQSTYAGVDYGYDVESVWLKVNELQGRGIVREIQVLGETRAACSMRVRLARNYESDGAGGWSYNYDQTWGVTPMVVGGPLQLKVAPSVKRPIQAIKVRLTALAPDKVSAPSGETCKLTSLAIGVAVEEGLYSGLPAAQKQ